MLLISIGLCVFVFFAKSKKWKIENIFLVIGTTLGLLFLLAIPIGRIPDEPAHFWKVFSVAQGNIVHDATQNNQSGNMLPVNVANTKYNYKKNGYSEIFQHLLDPISEDTEFVVTLNTIPINYLPHIIGAIIGTILHLPMLIVLYLARLCGLICCIIITYFCIKYIPILKKSLFFISCFPLTLQTFIGISYDGLIFCAGIVLVSFILYCIYNKNFTLKIRHYLLILCASLLLILVKPVYAPLCLLLFFIPTKCFGSNKKKILSIIGIGIITILCFWAWTLVPTIPTPPGNGSNPEGQVEFILSHPFNYLIILFNNMINRPFSYLSEAVTLEWLDVPMSQAYMFFTFAIFILICISERLSEPLKKVKFFRLACGACFILIISLIFLALYRGWTPVSADIIEGVQSRYFLPVILLIPLICLISNNQKSNKKPPLLNDLCIYGSIIMINTHMLVTIICSHL